MLHEGKTAPQSFSDNILPDYRVSGGLFCQGIKMPHLEVSSSQAVNKVSLATLFKIFLLRVVLLFITGPCVASALKELITQAASMSLFNNN